MSLDTTIMSVADLLSNPASALLTLAISALTANTAFRAIKHNAHKASTKPANKNGKVYPSMNFFLDSTTLAIALWFGGVAVIALINYGRSENITATIAISATLCLLTTFYAAGVFWDKERLKKSNAASMSGAR